MNLKELSFTGRHLCEEWEIGQFPGEKVRFLYADANEGDDCLCAIYSHGLVVLGPDSAD